MLQTEYFLTTRSSKTIYNLPVHRYFSSENLEKGDLVRLNENNEIVKTTEQKDSSVLGIVWYEFYFR